MLLGLVLLPFAAAFLMPLLYKMLRTKLGWVATLVPLSLFVSFLSLLPRVNAGEQIALRWIGYPGWVWIWPCAWMVFRCCLCC